jgi:exosortase
MGLLLYQRKESIKATIDFNKQKKANEKSSIIFMDKLLGLSLCLVAFLVYWYGSHTFHPLEIHLLSLPIFVTGLTLILSCMKTLRVLLPIILFLIFLVPIPSEFLYLIGGFTANFSTQAAYTTLKIFSIPVGLDMSYGAPTIYLKTSTGNLLFSVDLACSGIYSLLAFTMFAVFLVLILRCSFPEKIGIFLAGFILFQCLNVLRISLTVMLGYWVSEQAAMTIFHSFSGWLLIFAGTGLLLFLADKLGKIKFYSHRKPPFCSQCTKNLKKKLSFCSQCGRFLGIQHIEVSRNTLGKLLVLILGCLVITFVVQAPTFTISKGPGGIAYALTSENSTNVFPEIPNYTLEFIFRDVDYEKVSGQDTSLMYAYFPTEVTEPIIYVDLGIADTVSRLHNWEVCLISWQISRGNPPLVSVIDSRDIQLIKNPTLVSRFLVFQSPENYTQIVLYWIERAPFKNGLSVELKYVRISLIIFTQNDTNHRVFEEKLLNISREIVHYWQPLKTQALISIGIPAQQLLLISLAGFIGFMFITDRTTSLKKRLRNKKIFDRSASKYEKTILKTVIELTRTKKNAELQDITYKIYRENRLRLSRKKLAETLKRLEQYGFIAQDLTFDDDGPKIVWKSKT